MSLERSIEGSLAELDNFLRTSTWFGRENEVVNLFCHNFLLKHENPDYELLPNQCGIEVAVKQLPGQERKNLVRKDLVIWSKENETGWDAEQNPTNLPRAIIEWKVNSETKCTYDIDWLSDYTAAYPAVVGYSVCAHIKKNRSVRYWRVTNGEITKA